MDFGVKTRHRTDRKFSGFTHLDVTPQVMIIAFERLRGSHLCQGNPSVSPDKHGNGGLLSCPEAGLGTPSVLSPSTHHGVVDN